MRVTVKRKAGRTTVRVEDSAVLLAVVLQGSFSRTDAIRLAADMLARQQTCSPAFIKHLLGQRGGQ